MISGYFAVASLNNVTITNSPVRLTATIVSKCPSVKKLVPIQI